MPNASLDPCFLSHRSVPYLPYCHVFYGTHVFYPSLWPVCCAFIPIHRACSTVKDSAGLPQMKMRSRIMQGPLYILYILYGTVQTRESPGIDYVKRSMSGRDRKGPLTVFM